MKTRTLDEVVRTPARHWNVDGLPEMEIAAFLLLWGGVMVAGELWPTQVWRGVGAWAGIALAVAFLLFDRLALPRLKARITYPRVGYVRVRVSRARRVAAPLVAFVIAAGTAAWIVSARHRGLDDGDLPRVLGAVAAVAMTYASWRLGLARFYGYAAVAVIVALVLPTDISLDLGIGAFQMAMGVALWIGGTHAYRRLRSQPPASELER